MASEAKTITLRKAGSFYEAFDDDATTLSREMNITVTTSRDGRRLAGIPYHAITRYIQELEAKGYKVIRHEKTYQPKTGQPCSCRRGQQRDNCPACEGTGMKIDFAAIRARK